LDAAALDPGPPSAHKCGMTFVWVNKANWKKPGPIAYMGVLNALGLASSGHETHLFFSGEEGADVTADLDQFYGVSGHPLLNIHLVPKGSRWSELFGRNVYRHALRFIRRKLSDGRVVLLTREGGLLPAASRLCKSRRTFLAIYESHDLDADPSYRSEIRLSHRGQQWNERIFLPRISGLLCITREQQRLYKNLLPSVPSLALPLGCLTPPANPDWEKRRKLRRIAYTGHLHGQKGLSLLLGAAPMLAERDIELCIFGGHERQVSALREQFGAPKNVRLSPFLPPRKLRQTLAAEMSLGILPLQDNFYNRYLTCPAKALDYLSEGLPSVASDLPSTREVLGDSALFVPPEDPGALVAAVGELLDSSERYRQKSEGATQRAEELSWARRAAAIAAWAEARFEPAAPGATSRAPSASPTS
jgi:glycosyltransferase involved in cell wall biosynthesis